MGEERLKILKAMNEVTGKVDLKKFTEKVGLTLGQILECLQGLVNEGFVRKVNRRYSITSEGKIALKALGSVPKGKEFNLYTGIDQYTGYSVKNLKELIEQSKVVSIKALEFHVSRGDFENWITSVFSDTKLANEFSKMRESALSGESLRKEIVEVTETRYKKFGKLLS